MISFDSAKFSFHEIVKISPESEYKPLKNIKDPWGVIAGKSFDEEEKKIFYAVFIEELETVAMFPEDQLETTGKFSDPDLYKSGETIRVGVNEKGEGFIKSDK